MQQRVLTSLFLVGVGLLERRKRKTNSNREREMCRRRRASLDRFVPLLEVAFHVVEWKKSASSHGRTDGIMNGLRFAHLATQWKRHIFIPSPHAFPLHLSPQTYHDAVIKKPPLPTQPTTCHRRPLVNPRTSRPVLPAFETLPYNALRNSQRILIHPRRGSRIDGIYPVFVTALDKHEAILGGQGPREAEMEVGGGGKGIFDGDGVEEGSTAVGEGKWGFEWGGANVGGNAVDSIESGEGGS